MIYDAISGNYKAYKKARKEYASLAIQDFDTVRTMKAPKVTAPLFSKCGLNMLCVYVRDLFRIKTPDEKTLKKMGQEAIRQANINNINTSV
jgi:hypothetical protein